MQCPKCKGEDLTPATVGGVTVDRCPQCAGIWFDARELPRVLRLDSSEVRPLRGGRPDAARDEHAGKCPRDGGRMTRVNSATNAEVVLETCLECQGIWLDGGELDALRR
jgi:Zn-finger nucleic acid-binding protein